MPKDYTMGYWKEVDLTKSKKDNYEASLDYVNIIFNRKFRPRIRHNVPHIPIMIDKSIMKGFEFCSKKTLVFSSF